MFRIVAAYNQPEDPEKFLDHYQNVHLPLARTMPDVRSIQWGRVVDLAGGTPDAFVITTMDWDTKESALASLASPEGVAGNEDMANFAQAGVTVSMVEVAQ
ncbi:EthD family reductase [Nocardioides sp. BGMRC 2183]|jgi:uncharacterized protein (TIGR02118 family)|nr:EthD family reductase [Nocardioides sp. BGMRC 2183]